jgi:hypothetical protein
MCCVFLGDCGDETAMSAPVGANLVFAPHVMEKFGKKVALIRTLKR